jgi:hypothetical protein
VVFSGVVRDGLLISDRGEASGEGAPEGLVEGVHGRAREGEKEDIAMVRGNDHGRGRHGEDALCDERWTFEQSADFGELYPS